MVNRFGKSRSEKHIHGIFYSGVNAGNNEACLINYQKRRKTPRYLDVGWVKTDDRENTAMEKDKKMDGTGGDEEK